MQKKLIAALILSIPLSSTVYAATPLEALETLGKNITSSFKRLFETKKPLNITQTRIMKPEDNAMDGTANTANDSVLASTQKVDPLVLQVEPQSLNDKQNVVQALPEINQTRPILSIGNMELAPFGSSWSPTMDIESAANQIDPIMISMTKPIEPQKPLPLDPVNVKSIPLGQSINANDLVVSNFVNSLPNTASVADEIAQEAQTLMLEPPKPQTDGFVYDIKIMKEKNLLFTAAARMSKELQLPVIMQKTTAYSASCSVVKDEKNKITNTITTPAIAKEGIDIQIDGTDLTNTKVSFTQNKLLGFEKLENNGCTVQVPQVQQQSNAFYVDLSKGAKLVKLQGLDFYIDVLNRPVSTSASAK